MANNKINAKVIDLLNSLNLEAPPIDVQKIATSLGAKVNYVLYDDENVSGVLVKRSDEITIGVNSRHSENRQRFTIAHEIGHLLLHSNRPIFIDEVHTHFRDQNSAKGLDKTEIEANYFAAELLMPEKFVRQDMDNLNYLDEKAIQNLASKYSVSVEAFVYRVSNLGYSIFI